MPQRPPVLFLAGPRSFRNGFAARAQHAADLADYSAWLVAVRRHAKPAFIGAPMVSGHTYQLRTQIPHYTEVLAFGLLCTGEGTVTAKLNTDDTFDAEVDIAADDSHEYSDAQWTWIMTALDAVSGNGSARALDADDQSDPHMATFTVTVTDGSTGTCKVHSVILLPLPRSQVSVMPA